MIVGMKIDNSNSISQGEAVNQQTIFQQTPILADKLVEILILAAETQTTGNQVINRLSEIFKMNNISLQDIELSNLLYTLKPQVQSYDPKGLLKSGQLHPKLTSRVEKLLLEARDHGLNVFIFEGHRSIKKQNYLFQNGSGVTRARGGDSFHNYGLAADIVFYDQKGNPSWAEHHDWKKLGKIGKKWGLTWGGDFKKINDRTHFEYHPGLKLRDVMETYKKQGIKGVWDEISGKLAETK